MNVSFAIDQNGDVLTNDITNKVQYKEFDEDKYFGNDVIENPIHVPSNFDYCYLTRTDIEDLQIPRTKIWRDVKEKDVSTKFTIDSSKREFWKNAKKEFIHVSKQLQFLMDKQPEDDLSKLEILDFIFGAKSNIARTCFPVRHKHQRISEVHVNTMPSSSLSCYCY